MKKYFLIFILIFVISEQCFAADIPPVKPGKILPFNWNTPKITVEEVSACPTEDLIKNTMGKAMVTPEGNREGGVVIVKKNGIIQPLSPFMSVELEDGDEIKTKLTGTLITFADGSVVRMGYATSVKYYTNEKITKIELLVGKLRILLPSNFLKNIKAKIGPKLETKNRVSAACVRGTDYIMEYNAESNSGKYYLNEGMLDLITLSGEKIVLESGKVLSINKDGFSVKDELSKKVWDDLNKEIGVGDESQIERNIYYWLLAGVITVLFYIAYRKYK